MNDSYTGLRSMFGPLIPYMDDAAVTEIMVQDGGATVIIQRSGQMERLPNVTIAEGNLKALIKRVANATSQVVSEKKPLLTAHLFDGTRIIARISAVIPPASVQGAAIDIRLFQPQRRLPELVALGMLTEAQADELRLSIGNLNILIAGGTDAGKTTVLSALLGELPASERLVVIEDTAEIQATNQNIVRFEAQKPLDGDAFEHGRVEITQRDLVRMAMRFRPSMIVVGEVRGPEAYDLLQTANSGHKGIVSTIHASSARKALDRLADCALEANVGWSEATAAKRVRDAIDLVVYVQKQDDTRRVTDIVSIPKEA